MNPLLTRLRIRLAQRWLALKWAWRKWRHGPLVTTCLLDAPADGLGFTRDGYFHGTPQTVGRFAMQTRATIDDDGKVAWDFKPWGP